MTYFIQLLKAISPKADGFFSLKFKVKDVQSNWLCNRLTGTVKTLKIVKVGKVALILDRAQTLNFKF